MTRLRTFEAWTDSRAQNDAWVVRVSSTFGGYERERPRVAKEAALLRERGTDPRLIGPVASGNSRVSG